jgi:FtsZ-binding cell division protein ZapB
VETGMSGFKGFGEADINRIVDERFRERQRASEYEELKERVLELTEENEELQDSLEQIEAENQKLTQEIEGKKQIKYYAGMLGDILESFGIAKDRVKRPLAELMGIQEAEGEKKELNSPQSDASGIVEQKENLSPEESKRGEIISLISDYLRSTSNQTLASVFSIFSEIEANTTMAETILQFINQQKISSDAKI